MVLATSSETAVCSCSLKYMFLIIRNIYRKTSVLESLLQRDANFIKKRFQYRCFPVNIAKFLRTAFLSNTSGDCFWLLWKFTVLNLFNPFLVNLPILNPLKIPENRGYEMRTLTRNGSNNTSRTKTYYTC